MRQHLKAKAKFHQAAARACRSEAARLFKKAREIQAAAVAAGNPEEKARMEKRARALRAEAFALRGQVNSVDARIICLTIAFLRNRTYHQCEAKTAPDTPKPMKMCAYVMKALPWEMKPYIEQVVKDWIDRGDVSRSDLEAEMKVLKKNAELERDLKNAKARFEVAHQAYINARDGATNALQRRQKALEEHDLAAKHLKAVRAKVEAQTDTSTEEEEAA